jgi:hypothetical protein
MNLRVDKAMKDNTKIAGIRKLSFANCFTFIFGT